MHRGRTQRSDRIGAPVLTPFSNPAARIHRAERMIEDYRSLERVAALHPRTVRFAVADSGAVPSDYQLELRVRSITRVGEADTVEFADAFTFDVDLPDSYPESPPRFRSSNGSRLPFHPHFALSRPHMLSGREVTWVDYLPHHPDERLGCRVLRIARALAYDPPFVQLDAYRIGNPDAARWLEYARRRMDCEYFPVDKTDFSAGQDYCTTDEPPRESRRKTFDVAPTPHDESQNGPTPAHLPSAVGSRRKRFEVGEQQEPHRPTPTTEPPDGVVRFVADSGTGIDSGYQCQFSHPAWQAILSHIGWGRRTKANVSEQGGILVGRVYDGTPKGPVWAVVEHAIPARRGTGNDISLELGHAAWKDMIDELDRIRDAGAANAQVVGWYHTHPNRLDVFMSDADRQTQRRMFSEPWHFALVLNPHRQIWRVYHGLAASECAGYLLDPDSAATPSESIAATNVPTSSSIVSYVAGGGKSRSERDVGGTMVALVTDWLRDVLGYAVWSK